MEPHCLSFREIPHTTKLFSSFLEDFNRVARYYAHPPTETGIADAAREVRLDPAVRRSVVEVLREQNALFGKGSALELETARNLDRLAAGAVAIVTGQQVGLFSGPAYSVYKAISAARTAEEATRRGVDAVPVFWLATEDHDLAEVNHSLWNTRNGLARHDLGGNEEQARRIGEITLGEAVQPLVGTAAESLEGPFADEIALALRESYSPRETYGSAFGKLMAHLFAGRGIVFLDPLDARLQRLAVPACLRAVNRAETLRDALVARSKQLEHGGFHAQVKVTPEQTLLFYNVDGHRQPVRSHNGKFIAGTASFTPDELRAAILETPEAFTPSVLLRPVIQDTLLPTAAYIGGPAEIAYMAQAQVVYEGILGRMPAILPRASFTIVEPPIARLLTKYGLDFHDVLRGSQRLRTKMEQSSLPRGLARRFETDERVVRRLLKSYLKPLGRLDRSLIGTLQTAERKILHQFSKLKSKAGRAESFRTGVLDRHERILLDSLYPHRGLQERSLSALPFLAAYGREFLDDLGRLFPAPGYIEGSAYAHQHRILYL
jgi:bacillithiol biosynthesis cysteine-adding enzyme BshC